MAKSEVVDRDLGWSAIFRRLNTRRTAAVLVGIDESEGADLPLIAARNEFGTEHIPERSFLRRTVDGRRSEYVGLLTDAEDDLIIRGLPVEVVMRPIGAKVVEDVKDAIRAGIRPENAEQTLDQKQGTTPLIDTGRLIGAIDFHVEEE